MDLGLFTHLIFLFICLTFFLFVVSCIYLIMSNLFLILIYNPCHHNFSSSFRYAVQYEAGSALPEKMWWHKWLRYNRWKSWLSDKPWLSWSDETKGPKISRQQERHQQVFRPEVNASDFLCVVMGPTIAIYPSSHSLLYNIHNY